MPDIIGSDVVLCHATQAVAHTSRDNMEKRSLPVARQETKPRAKEREKRESQREPKRFGSRCHIWQGDESESIFTSSYVVLKISAQKPQELDIASLPRDRHSGCPFSIKHAHHFVIG